MKNCYGFLCDAQCFHDCVLDYERYFLFWSTLTLNLYGYDCVRVCERTSEWVFVIKCILIIFDQERQNSASTVLLFSWCYAATFEHILTSLLSVLMYLLNTWTVVLVSLVSWDRFLCVRGQAAISLRSPPPLPRI